VNHGKSYKYLVPSPLWGRVRALTLPHKGGGNRKNRCAVCAACVLAFIWKRQGYIDTIAAAYAETGNFEQAVKYQLLALEDAGYQQRHGTWARKVLELYKDKKPYRKE
jgi:hypothetical protein